MTASQLIARVRKNGARVWLDQLGRLNAEGMSEGQMKELGDSYDLVVALLQEEIVGKRWEASGKDVRWWKFPEHRWRWPSQELRFADEAAFNQWLKDRCAADRRCSGAVKFLYWDFCEQHGQELFPKVFLELLSAAGFEANGGFVDGLVLGSDLHEWDEAAGNHHGSEEGGSVHHGDEGCQELEDCALVGE
jgi:hypothetical protein